MPSPTAVFDLDGTLADTAVDLILTANALLESRGLPGLDIPASRNAAGMGGRALVRLGYHRAGTQISDEAVEALYPRFLELYDERRDRATDLFPGVPETLDLLREAGWRLAVCTNKPVRPAHGLLERKGILDRFACVLGGDSLDVRKPHPRHLLETVAMARGATERAVMVGDSRIDLEAAQGAGMPCVLMRYGYSPEPVDELGAEAALDEFGALPTTFRELRVNGRGD